MEKNYEIVDSLEKLSARLEKIKKAQKAIDYKNAVNSLFIEQDIIKGAGLFNNEV